MQEDKKEELTQEIIRSQAYRDILAKHLEEVDKIIIEMQKKLESLDN
jgi:hypothetical protein